MIAVTKYRTTDGYEYDTEQEALDHEAAIGDSARVKRWLDTLPRDGDDAVSDRARSRLGNDVMRFLSWERENAA